MLSPEINRKDLSRAPQAVSGEASQNTGKENGIESLTLPPAQNLPCRKESTAPEIGILSGLLRNALYFLFSARCDFHPFLDQNVATDICRKNTRKAALRYLAEGDTTNRQLAPALPLLENRSSDPLFKHLAPYVLRVVVKGTIAAPQEEKERWLKLSLSFLSADRKSIRALSEILEYNDFSDSTKDCASTLATFLGQHADRETIRKIARKICGRSITDGLTVIAPGISLLFDLDAPRHSNNPKEVIQAVLYLEDEDRLDNGYDSDCSFVAKEILEISFNEKMSESRLLSQARKFLKPGGKHWLNEHDHEAHRAAATLVLLMTSDRYSKELAKLLAAGGVKSDITPMAIEYMKLTDTQPAGALFLAVKESFARTADSPYHYHWLDDVSKLGTLARELVPLIAETYKRTDDADIKSACLKAFMSAGYPCFGVTPLLCEELDCGKPEDKAVLCKALGVVAAGSRDEDASRVLTFCLFSEDQSVRSAAKAALKSIDGDK